MGTYDLLGTYEPGTEQNEVIRGMYVRGVARNFKKGFPIIE